MSFLTRFRARSSPAALPRSIGATARAGLLLTLAAVAADVSGVLDGLERWLYDERVARCQFFMPPPTDRLVHLDIDDASLESIGKWPWDRAVLAELMDELALAQPAAVALDILLSEPQLPRYEPAGDGPPRRVDGDEMLAASLARLGNTLVPASFQFPSDAPPARYHDVRDVLIADLELGESAVVDRLVQPGVDRATLERQVTDVFLIARHAAMFTRIKQAIAAADLTEQELRRRLLPGMAAQTVGPLTRLLAEELGHVRAAAALEHRSQPFAPEVMPPMWTGVLRMPPIPSLVRSSTASGFVDYPTARDGRVRSVPLFIKADGHVYPQMGLSLACLTMGVPIDAVRLSPRSVTVPRPGKSPLVIPTRTIPARDLTGVRDDVPMAFDLPWFGSDDWRLMYARDGSGAPRQHLPVLKVWEASRTRQRIEANNRQIDDAMKSMYVFLDRVDDAQRIAANPLPPADWRGRVERATAEIARVADDIAFQVESLRALGVTEPATSETQVPIVGPPTTDDAEVAQVRGAIRSYEALRNLVRQAGPLAAQLDETRAFLRESLRDKAVLVGWIATASTDIVATPLHERCPGVVAHGLVFNTIMTGEVWRCAPWWASALLTLGVGLLVTLAVSDLPPAGAFASAIALAATYLLLNGLALFDYANVIVGAAGPATAVGVVWSGGTLTRLVVERRQRALIRRRFRTYVDPRLVEYVERHPEQAAFSGERREMTVVFTDLVGFTHLTEVLGEETVGMLNELWTRVVPVIRRDGYLNKFLGDGVMFFYGAPERNEDHAAHAVRAALELCDVMRKFNQEVTAPRRLAPLGMRIGVSTGFMIVGDAGAGAAASDYTVLGDNVNLASRLEGANKIFGTSNLCTQRTADLAGGTFLFRPIGNICVVGKRQGVMTCEALCPLAAATPRDHHIVRLTRQVVDAYREERLDECLRAVDELEAVTGPAKLTTLYRSLVTRHLDARNEEPFDCLITLETK